MPTRTVVFYLLFYITYMMEIQNIVEILRSSNFIMIYILNVRSILRLHGIWNQNQFHKHSHRKIYKYVISSLYNIIRLFFTPNQHNHFTRRFIYVLSQVFCDQEMCMFIFSIEILREEQLNRLYYMMNLVVVKEKDHTGHISCMTLTLTTE